MKKTIVVVLFVLFASSAQSGEKRFSVPIVDSPGLGPSDARVTVIEFIDFQ